MHFIVSWDMKSDGKRWTEINNAMTEALHGYSWLRLLSTFYILDINSNQDWFVIQENLLSVAQKYPGEVNFLMSPIYDFESESEFFVYKMPENAFYQT